MRDAVPATSIHSGAGLLTASLALAGRNLRRFARTPQLLIITSFQAVIFLLIFRYVFGGAINTGEVTYVNYLIPGIVIAALLFAGASGAVALAEDLERGVVDRFNSLPISRTAVLLGRVIADFVVVAWAFVVTVVTGVLVGFRPEGSLDALVLAVALCLAVAFVFSWVFVVLGLVAGSAQSAEALAFLLLPLTFVSSAYVPVETMPAWLRVIAEHQPVTVLADAVRALTLEASGSVLARDTTQTVAGAVMWCIVLVVLAAGAATVLYRRRVGA